MKTRLDQSRPDSLLLDCWITSSIVDNFLAWGNSLLGPWGELPGPWDSFVKRAR